jgi:hypothetical protein
VAIAAAARGLGGRAGRRAPATADGRLCRAERGKP